MKYRKSPKFPGYKFYIDGRIVNEITGKVIRKKKHMKLCHKSINTPKLLAKIFKIPNPNNYKLLGFKDNDPNNWAINNLYWYTNVKEPQTNKAPLTRHRRKKDQYDKMRLKGIKKDVMKGMTYDDILHKYNIPVGSIGYVINKALGNDKILSSNPLVISIKINKIVIK